MRLVLAVLRPSQVESVRRALDAVDVTRLTVCDAQGRGPDGGLVQESILEIAVNDDFLDRTTGAIAGVLEASGDGPAGRLFTLPMTEAVQLYRAVRGPEAV
ncbi:MAG: hypothetical protein RLZZ440_1133 [Planctomycetota bacterium]